MHEVEYRGVRQPFELLTPAQQRDYHDVERYNAPQAPRSNTDPDGIRSLPDAAKASLRRSGYTGDLSALPPTQESGKLVQQRTVSRSGVITDTFAGSPKAWMRDFEPPVVHRVIAWRRNHQDLDWGKLTQTAALRFKENNPHLKGIDTHLMYSADPEHYLTQKDPHAGLKRATKAPPPNDGAAKSGGLLRKLLG